MSIRLKIILVLSSLSLCVLALNIFVALRFVLPGFDQVEKEKAKVSVERVYEAFNSEYDYLGSQVADWANWDDSYEFIIDRNETYIDSNLTDVSLENLKVDLMLFLNTEDEFVYQKGIDMDTGQPITDFSGWDEHIKTGAVLADYDRNEFKKGLLMIGDRPALFASRPILTSDGSGPRRGTIIFAKFFDSVEVKKMAHLTKRELSVIRPNKSVYTNKGEVLNMSNETNDVYVEVLDKDNLAGHFLIRDFYGKPGLFIETKIKRDIYSQGLLAVKYSILFSTLAGLILLIMTILLLEKMVIRRIIKFNTAISEIAQCHDFSRRVEVSGKDEISKMGTDTNIMLRELEKAIAESEVCRKVGKK